MYVYTLFYNFCLLLKMLVKGFQPPLVLGKLVLKSKREEGSEVFWCPDEGNEDVPDDLRASEIQGKG